MEHKEVVAELMLEASRPRKARPGVAVTTDEIPRWHQTPKNRILFENHDLPGDLEARIEASFAHNNHQRQTIKNPCVAHPKALPNMTKQMRQNVS